MAYNEMLSKKYRDSLITNMKDDIEKIVRDEIKIQLRIQKEEHDN